MTPGDKAQRLIVRGGMSAAAGFLIRFGARILFLFVAARLFGVALFGAYSLGVAAVELGVTAAGLGTKRLLFKLLDEEDAGLRPAHVVLDAALLVLAAGGLLASAIILAVSLLPSSALAGNTAMALCFLAPMIAGQALLDLFSAATRWRHRMRYEVVSRSIVEPYAGVAAAVAAYAAGFQETGLLIGYWAGTLAALAYATAGARRCFGGFGLTAYAPHPLRLLAILRESALPTASDFLSGLFGRLDLYLVGMFLGEAPAGIYGMARQVRTPIRQVRQSFDGLLTPIIAKTLALVGPAETGAATASATRLILALQLPVLIALILVGWPLLHWLGPEFAAGYWAMVLLAGAETIQGAFGVSSLILLYRRPALVLGITAVSVAVNLVAGWALIGAYGVAGAALAVLAAVLSEAALRRLALRAGLGIDIPFSHSAGPLSVALVAVAAALAVRAGLAPISVPVADGSALAAGLIAYAAGLKTWMAATGETLSLARFRLE